MACKPEYCIFNNYYTVGIAFNCRKILLCFSAISCDCVTLGSCICIHVVALHMHWCINRFINTRDNNSTVPTQLKVFLLSLQVTVVWLRYPCNAVFSVVRQMYMHYARFVQFIFPQKSKLNYFLADKIVVSIAILLRMPLRHVAIVGVLLACKDTSEIKLLGHTQ